MGLPELADKLAQSENPPLDGRLIRKLTHTSYREAHMVWSAVEITF